MKNKDWKTVMEEWKLVLSGKKKSSLLSQSSFLKVTWIGALVFLVVGTLGTVIGGYTSLLWSLSMEARYPFDRGVAAPTIAPSVIADLRARYEARVTQYAQLRAVPPAPPSFLRGTRVTVPVLEGAPAASSSPVSSASVVVPPASTTTTR